MNSVIRAHLVYGFVIVVFRLTGRRSLSSITIFDFVLLLIISETIQAALTDMDNSLTNSYLLILTFLMANVGLSLVKERFPRVESVIEGDPVVIVEHGRPLLERMAKFRVDMEDVLRAGRETQGLERLDQIKYAVLERGGGISIIPQGRSGGP